MRVAVYTIALNEEQFVETWFHSAKEADLLLIADTGSTDLTVDLAESLGISVIKVGVAPWRFDDARNAALAAIPKDFDYCIALDMDEVLLPGWREELESLPAGVTRPRYKYTWSWNADGSPGLEYGGDKIHSRAHYRWRHPVHEVLTYFGDGGEVQHWTGLEIHHHPDSTKSRAQYAPMLAMAVAEDPTDDRNAYYYARELYFGGRYAEAAAEFKRHLELPKAVWPPERAASMRYLSKCEPENSEHWLKLAVAESYRREPLVDLSKLYHDLGNWEQCLHYSQLALAITEKPLDYLCEADAWGWLPHDLAALASYHLGDKDAAKKHGEAALSLNPSDKRLATNLEFYVS